MLRAPRAATSSVASPPGRVSQARMRSLATRDPLGSVGKLLASVSHMLPLFRALRQDRASLSVLLVRSDRVILSCFSEALRYCFLTWRDCPTTLRSGSQSSSPGRVGAAETSQL